MRRPLAPWWAAALAGALALLMVLPAGAVEDGDDCDDLWRQAEESYALADGQARLERWTSAAAAYAAAAQAWRRAVTACGGRDARLAQDNAAVAEKNARAARHNQREKDCQPLYQAAMALTRQAQEFVEVGNWVQAAEAFRQAEKAWLVVAGDCPAANAERATKNAMTARTNARIAHRNARMLD